MKNEAEFKSIFCDKVKKIGGYTIRLAGPLVSGLPDIYCSVPTYVPLLLEAKFMKGLKENFERKIQITPIQKHILDGCWKSNPRTAYILLGVEYEGNIYCGMLPHSTQKLYDQHILTFQKIIKNNIDIGALFYRTSIPRIP